MFIQKQGSSSEKLKADILPQHFVSLEKGMHSLIVAVAKVALAHEVDDSHMVIGEGEEFIAEKYCVRVVVQVEVINRKIVKPFQALVAEDSTLKCVEFGEEVLGVISIIRLQQFC